MLLRPTKFAMLFAALLASAAACAVGGNDAENAEEAATTANRLDVNDVSFIFPLPKNDQEVPLLLGLDARTADGSELLDAASFEKALAFGGRADDPNFRFDKRDSWRIVAARVDPCSKRDPNATSCQAQLRLIAQPVVKQTKWSTGDDTFHLVYNLDSANWSALLSDLRTLKSNAETGPKRVKTAGKALSVHPTMKAEGLAGPFAEGLRNVLLKYASSSKMQGVAIMLTLRAGEWRFALAANFPTATSVGPELVQVQPPCSSTERKTISLHGTTGVVGGFIDRIEPPAIGLQSNGTCRDTINELVQSNPGSGNAFFGATLTDEQRKEAVNAEYRIDNPLKHTTATADCTACHVGSRALARVRDQAPTKFEFDANAERFKAPAGVTSKFASDATDQRGPYNVRNFGYQNDKPVYTMRTLNETMLVVQQINEAH